MSVEDLAIDVGLVKDTDEFDVFLSCVNNILDFGCSYSDEVTTGIMDKCYTSELDIAKKVLRECRRRPKTTSVRKSRLKWWQSYIPKRGVIEDRQPAPPAAKKRRRMELSFSKPGRRPMELTFCKSERRHKPSERRHVQPERRHNPPERRHVQPRGYRPHERHRPRSPPTEQGRRYQHDSARSGRPSPVYEDSQYERSSVPRWPGQNNRKRRRYR